MRIGPEVAAVAAHNNAHPPVRLGQRYNAQRFLPDPGNTVVCHLDHGAPGAQAVLEARARMQALPGAERFLFTPEDSLHMTVFEGVLDARRKPDAWPADLDMHVSVEEVTRTMIGRLQNFEAQGTFAVRIAKLRPGGLELCGASAQDVAVLLAWREALTKPFGYRQDVHDTYRHHMTFAYPVDWLPDDLLAEWQAGLAEIEADLVRSVPVLPLRGPAFCRFADMTWFEELLQLA